MRAKELAAQLNEHIKKYGNHEVIVIDPTGKELDIEQACSATADRRVVGGGRIQITVHVLTKER